MVISFRPCLRIFLFSSPCSMKKWLPGIFLLAAAYHVVLYPYPTFRKFLIEDGPFENLSAIAFLSAGILFLMAFRNSGNREKENQKNYYFLPLGILLLFIAGEEISWGQRLFGYELTDFFATENIQQESNLHNLKLFNSTDEQNIRKPWWYLLSMSRLFRIFWFTFGLVIPLACLRSARLRSLARRLNFPVLSIETGIFFPLNYAVFKTLQLILPPDTQIVEIEECVHGMLFLLAGAYFARSEKQRHAAVEAIF